MTTPMPSISLPKSVEVIPDKIPNRARITIEPCFPGYGTTLGNALRRVLLSSIPGAAITSVSIKGVTHEFTTLPNAKEDMVEFILQVKQVRLRLHGSEPVTIKLKAKGEKVIKAKDIEATSDVEIMSPSLHLLTLTDSSAEFEAEFRVEHGLGYVPVENREKSESDDVNTIMVDAVYTPIRTVNFTVEHVRVGQMTNFDKLNLDIETDGTVSPAEAFQQANEILLQHYAMFHEQVTAGEAEEKPAKKTAKKREEEGDESDEKTDEESKE